MVNYFNPLKFHRRLYRFSSLDNADLKFINQNLPERELTIKIERFMLNYIGMKYAIFVPTCRAALEILLKAMNIKKTDNIITQAYGCHEIIDIIRKHCQVKYCDIEENTFNINPNSIAKAIDKNTRAVLPINIYGNPAKIEKIKQICKKKKILFIEDCAHSLGSEIKGRKVGSFGDVSIFSFGKSLVGSGGMIMTNNKDLFDKIKLIEKSLIIKKSHNLSKSFGKAALFNIIKLKGLQRVFPIWLFFFKLFESKSFRAEDKSYLLKPNNLELSLCLTQLRKNNKIIGGFINNYKTLYRLLRNVKGIKVIDYIPGSIALRFPIEFEKDINPDRFLNFIYRKGCFEPSLNYFNEYKINKRYAKQNLPISEKVAKRLVVVRQNNLKTENFFELKKLIMKFLEKQDK